MTADTLAGVTANSLVGVSGDPGLVNAMADHYESVAASIRGAAIELRSLEAGSSSSDALDAFLAKAQQVSASLGKAEGRYGETGSALKTYASELSLAQEAAAPALANHRDAVDDLAAAERLVERYDQLALVATDEVTKQEHLDQAAAQRAKADDARGRVAIYARRLADAHASVETAANTAIARIDDATDDGLDDTVWDDLGAAWDAGFAAFQTWMEENDSWISTVVDALTIVGGLLAFASLFIPGLNLVILAVMAVSLGLAVGRFAAGTGTALDLAMALVSVATLGIGGTLVASARSSIKVVSANRVAGLVRSGNTRRLATLRVSTSWSRAQPGLGDRFLLKSFGDQGVAQMLHFLRSTRPGAFADDPAQIARTLAKLNSARVIQAVDQGRSVAEGAAAWLGVDLPATVWRRLSTSKGSL
ncbi:flavin-binding protein dodecin [Frigoribacterium sp. PvP054]|uniref:putative T7SS-secreted protein n=1 Tax=Frigoribacterium sp. PvP054 TaxID=3156438 RepID=UPI003392034F